MKVSRSVSLTGNYGTIIQNKRGQIHKLLRNCDQVENFHADGQRKPGHYEEDAPRARGLHRHEINCLLLCHEKMIVEGNFVRQTIQRRCQLVSKEIFALECGNRYSRTSKGPQFCASQKLPLQRTIVKKRYDAHRIRHGRAKHACRR